MTDTDAPTAHDERNPIPRDKHTYAALLGEFEAAADSPDAAARVLLPTLTDRLKWIGELRDSAVIYYGSSFTIHQDINSAIDLQDINGFMAAVSNMPSRQKLSLLIHTQGGLGAAAETIVDYLRQCFDEIEVIVPLYAFSAGTMIALGADRILMGKQSQLGPIDPQIPFGGTMIAAGSILEDFRRAQRELVEAAKNGTIHGVAAAWGPILRDITAGQMRAAELAIQFGESLVAEWLRSYMLKDGDGNAGSSDPASTSGTEATNAVEPLEDDAARIARFFSDELQHHIHSRRISADRALAQGLKIERLEDSQDLQNAVLGAHHITSLIYQVPNGGATIAKLIAASSGAHWMSNVPR